MDTPHPATRAGVTYLSECVSDQMSPEQAADATTECWTHAEEALAPVLGKGGVGVVFREGEKLAARKVGKSLGEPAPGTVQAFSEWAKALEPQAAVAVCVAFLASVERYLVKLLGAPALQRILKRNRGSAP